MKLKIVNMKKFISSLIMVTIGIIFLLFTGFSNTYSKVDIRYKDEYIISGDTIWKIAEKEASENKYFKNVDVRSIVKEIKNINNIKNETLEIGQKILI